MKKAKKIVFANNKGGVGKTTLSSNYASLLSKKGFKVLIIDADSQANMLNHFNKYISGKLKCTLLDITFREHVKVEDCIIDINENLSLIPCEDAFKDFDYKVLNGEKFKHFKDIIKEIEALNIYDYILIDTEPKKSTAVLTTLVSSDEVIIPFTYTSSGVSGIFKMKQFIDVAKRTNKNLKIKALVGNKFEMVSKAHKEIKQQMEKLDIYVAKTIINKSIADETNIVMFGEPICLTKRNNKFTLAFQDLVQELENL
ncbi:ParA family protein [Candidatus Mycoplasma pogonae]